MATEAMAEALSDGLDPDRTAALVKDDPMVAALLIDMLGEGMRWALGETAEAGGLDAAVGRAVYIEALRFSAIASLAEDRP